MTFPALALLRQRFPLASIEVVGNRLALELARGNGLIDGVDAFGADWVSDLFGDEPTPALRARLTGIDLGIVWMHSLDAARDLAASLERAGVRTTLPATSFPEPGSGLHIADQLIAALAPLGVSAARPVPRILGSRSTLPTVTTTSPMIEADASDHLVVIHPGAGGRRKRWPADRYAALADRLILAGYTVALTTGPSDDNVAEVVRGFVPGKDVQVLADRSLAELASIFNRSRLFVGNDSGITHLASLAGAPTLAIFGPFDPAYWAPIGPLVSVVDAGLSCTHRGDPRDGCRVCDPMPSLSIETVWNAAEVLLRCGT